MHTLFFIQLFSLSLPLAPCSPQQHTWGMLPNDDADRNDIRANSYQDLDPMQPATAYMRHTSKWRRRPQRHTCQFKPYPPCLPCLPSLPLSRDYLSRRLPSAAPSSPRPQNGGQKICTRPIDASIPFSEVLPHYLADLPSYYFRPCIPATADTAALSHAFAKLSKNPGTRWAPAATFSRPAAAPLPSQCSSACSRGESTTEWVLPLSCLHTHAATPHPPPPCPWLLTAWVADRNATQPQAAKIKPGPQRHRSRRKNKKVRLFQHIISIYMCLLPYVYLSFQYTCVCYCLLPYMSISCC